MHACMHAYAPPPSLRPVPHHEGLDLLDGRLAGLKRLAEAEAHLVCVWVWVWVWVCVWVCVWVGGWVGVWVVV